MIFKINFNKLHRYFFLQQLFSELSLSFIDDSLLLSLSSSSHFIWYSARIFWHLLKSDYDFRNFSDFSSSKFPIYFIGKIQNSFTFEYDRILSVFTWQEDFLFSFSKDSLESDRFRVFSKSYFCVNFFLKGMGVIAFEQQASALILYFWFMVKFLTFFLPLFIYITAASSDTFLYTLKVASASYFSVLQIISWRVSREQDTGSNKGRAEKENVPPIWSIQQCRKLEGKRALIDEKGEKSITMLEIIFLFIFHKINPFSKPIFAHKYKLMRVLILGAYGQVGLELIRALSSRMSPHDIFASDVREPPPNAQIKNHLILNALDKDGIYEAIKKNKITQVYCLTALLSATGEVNPLRTDEINMKALFNTLEAGRELGLDKVFWPSSIAAFGDDTPKQTDQQTIMNPSTVYGITKKSGQLWCAYYAKRFGLDIRSIRYPGLVGYRSEPGGGTTDYAVDIYHKALKGQVFESYLAQNAYLPMVYTDDAIEGTIQLMQAPKENITIRTSYNIQSMTFCPSQIAAQIKKHIPSFKIVYKVDPVRQTISETWPQKIKDDEARKDWGWNPKFDLSRMTKQILDNLKV